jgi:hypothetical protein
MRTEIVKNESWTITVRGRTRRSMALESEYLLILKSAHAEMRPLLVTKDSSPSQMSADDPRASSLLVASSQFRYLAARISQVEMPDGNVAQEPFGANVLLAMFEDYLDTEIPPDNSDLWSRVELAMVHMDEPPKEPDPKGGSSTEKK